MTNVLLCDTTDGVARLQYELLRSDDGLNVEVTTDAFRAIEAAARARPDVIVTELTMEGLAGAELVKRFRASSPTSRVIAWTRAENPRGIAEVLAAGALTLSGKLADNPSTVTIMETTGVSPRWQADRRPNSQARRRRS